MNILNIVYDHFESIFDKLDKSLYFTSKYEVMNDHNRNHYDSNTYIGFTLSLGVHAPFLDLAMIDQYVILFLRYPQQIRIKHCPKFQKLSTVERMRSTEIDHIHSLIVYCAKSCEHTLIAGEWEHVIFNLYNDGTVQKIGHAISRVLSYVEQLFDIENSIVKDNVNNMTLPKLIELVEETGEVNG